MAKLGIACIQLTSLQDWQLNLNKVLELMTAAMDQKPRLLVLPENVFLFDAKQMRALSESESAMVILEAIKQFASEKNVYVLIGSHPMALDQDSRLVKAGRVRQSSLLIGPEGEVLARYDKIHLFDVDVDDKANTYRESRYIEPGENTPVVYLVDDVCLGFSICYDLRFPEYYRRLAELGAEVVVVPSAFTYKTGEAHWHTLLCARAIENQFYVAGVGQVGWHSDTRRTYGNTVAYSPWGELIDKLDGEQEGIIYFEVDKTYLKSVRSAMPCLQHRRL